MVSKMSTLHQQSDASAATLGEAVRLSVIIPCTPLDLEVGDLVKSLLANVKVEEVVLVGDSVEPIPPTPRLRILPSTASRAERLNLGAASTHGNALWFLHADSRLLETTVDCGVAALREHPSALLYFNLRFTGSRFTLMRLTELGVMLRSHLLRLPFGDQGFLGTKQTFLELGSYPEEAPFGEDHLLVWRAHQTGVPVLSTGASLETSPRKYQKHGWLAVTVTHIYNTAAQAIPELFKLISSRFGTIQRIFKGSR
jgi:hypothetical protein